MKYYRLFYFFFLIRSIDSLANTHLFWHPMADHIRAMQAFAVVKKIDEIRQAQDPFLLCGDLNSDPLSGTCKLLTTRIIAADHHDCWNYLDEYKWDVDDNDVDSMVDSGTTAEERRSSHQSRLEATTKTSPPLLALPDSFPQIISGCQPNPPFTNFSLRFVETLDYVLASRPSENDRFGFSRKESAPMPCVEDVKEFVSMVSGLNFTLVTLLCDARKSIDHFFHCFLMILLTIETIICSPMNVCQVTMYLSFAT